MNKEMIKKLLPATTVFVFVAFCFAIANTFGGTYAISGCPSGWTEEAGGWCNKLFDGYKTLDEASTACKAGLSTYKITTISGRHGVCDCTQDPDGTYSCGGTINPDMLVYLKFDAVEGKIYRSSGTSSQMATLTREKGSYTLLKETNTDGYYAKREGYKLAGWTTTKGSCSSPLTGSVSVQSDATYYACWLVGYTLKFDPNNGNLSNSNNKEIECFTRTGSSTCQITSPAATRSGYTLKGWSTDKSCTNVKESGTWVVDESMDDTTYYACWTSGSTNAKVTFNFYVNDGDTISKNSDYCNITSGNTTCQITFPTATRKGYTLKGWSRDPNCSPEYNTFTSKINATEGMNGDKFYACWEKAESSGPTDDGYKFLAFLSANGGSFASGVTLDSNNYYRASCIAESATSSCTIKAADMPKPTRSGYTFKGWSKSSTGENVMTEIKLTSNGTYYAVWVENTTENTFKVTFDANNGTIDGKESDSCTTTGSSCTIKSLPIAKRDNYSFGGWGTSKTCTTGATTEIKLTGNATYYACWTEKTNEKVARNYYTVKFELDGGKFIDGRTSQVHITDDQSITYAPKTNPVKEGYVFDGWYKGNEKYNLGGVVRENLTLTAHWKKTETNCTGVCNSGDVYEPSIDKCVSVQKFDGNTYYTSKLNQERTCTNGLYEKTKDGTSSGHSCSADYDTKEVYRPKNTCKIESTCTSGTSEPCVEEFEARCFKIYEPTDKKCTSTIKYYEAKFDLDGGEFADGSTGRITVIPNNENLTRPSTNPVKEGYKFIGWYVENDEFVFPKKLTGNVTIKARWEEIKKSNCTYSCNAGDLYDPSTGNCISAQKFDGNTYYSTTYNATRNCQYGIFEFVEQKCAEGSSCGKYSCDKENGYTLQDVYKPTNTCQIKTNCDSATGTTGTCEEVWKVHCYKTYEAESDCSKAANYKVEFKVNGGTLYVDNQKTTTTIYDLANITYSKYTAKKDKFIFKGWSESSDCNNIITKKIEDLTYDKIVYACYMEDKQGDEINKNSQTSSTVLYLVYLIGILALCYTVYYSYNYAKSRR